MSARNGVVVGVAVVLVIGAGVLLKRGGEPERGGSLEPFVSTLADSIPRVATIEIARGDESVELVRVGDDQGAWTVASAGGYPVRIDAVREIVAGLQSLVIDEPLTAKRERHGDLGLAWPDASGRATLLRLLDAGGQPLHEIVIGEEGPATRSRYVRRLSEDQTYRCRGGVSVETTVRSFVEPEVLFIDQKDIRSIAYDGLVLAREAASDEAPIPAWKAELAGPLADGAWPEEQRTAAIQTLPSWATRLDLEDVRRRDREGAAWTSDASLTLTYFLSNATVTIEGMREEDALWVRVSAVVTPAAPESPPPTDGAKAFDWAAWNDRMAAWEFLLPEWKSSGLAGIREAKPTIPTP